MTAEERIQAAWEAARNDPNFGLAPVSTEAMHLAAAIRAAEDDALEGAARTLEWGAHPTGVGGIDTRNIHRSGAFKDAAGIVRSLRSQSKPSGSGA